MRRIERSIEVGRPPGEVFALLTDLDRLPEWATIVVATRDVSQVPLRRGNTFKQTVRVLGQEIESEWTVVDFDPPRRVAYTATAPGGGEMRMTQTVGPAGDGSRVDLKVEYEVPGGLLGELFDHLVMEEGNEREAEASLAALKRLLETDGGRS